MKKQSWKQSDTIPRFVLTAVRKGLRIADSVAIDEANDKSRVTITFKRFPPAERQTGKTT